MSAFVLTDGAAYLGQYPIGQHLDGAGDMSGNVDMVEVPKLTGGGFRHFIPGLARFAWMLRGWVGYDTGEIGVALSGSMVGTQHALTLLPQQGSTQAVGGPAVIYRGLVESIKVPQGQVGGLATFELGTQGDAVQVVGVVGAPEASRGGSGALAAVAMTGPTATQSMYLAVHVTVATGTNLTVILESDDNAGFTSATTRITSATVSAPGWQFLSVPGPLSSETHWRVRHTISTASFTYLAAFGVA